MISSAVSWHTRQSPVASLHSVQCGPQGSARSLLSAPSPSPRPAEQRPLLSSMTGMLPGSSGCAFISSGIDRGSFPKM